MGVLKAMGTKKMPEKADLVKQIDYYDLESTKQDIKDWQNSRLIAMQVINPDWTDYIRVCEDITIDAHLYGIMSTLKDLIKAREFSITDNKGSVLEDKTKLFEQDWFYDFLEYAIDGYFFPYSVIQLGSMINDGFPEIKLINREYFIPQRTFIKKSLYSYGRYQHGMDGWDINVPELKPYFISVISDVDLGLLDKVAYHVLGKKHMLIYWWRYGEIFGIPMRIGKTDIKDVARRKNMEKMVSSMGSSLWAVIDPDDEVNLVETTGGSSTINIFNELMRYSNAEISKALMGTDSIMDIKSFVGSAEVGERLFEARQKAYLRKLKNIINKELIPRMIFYGLPLNGVEFKWNNEDKVTYTQKLETIRTLLPHFEFDETEITDMFGFTVTKKVGYLDDIRQREKETVMPEVSALYKDIFKKNSHLLPKKQYRTERN